MGGISAEEVFASAVVAAVISGAVSLLVARWQARATVEAGRAAVEAARVAAAEERRKAADVRARETREAIRRAAVALQIAGTMEVDWAVRQEQAGTAIGGLIEVVAILGDPVRTPHFNRLVDGLNARTEAGLEEAARIWPRVQLDIVAALED